VAEASGGARHERERLDPRRRADTNAAVLAERFRARLTELGIAPGATEPSALVAAPFEPPTAQPAPPERERTLWVAGAFGLNSGGLGAMPEAELELRVFPARWLSTSAFGKATLAPAEVRGAEGETDVRLVSGGVLIDVYPVRREWLLKLGVGALLVSANMTGHAEGAFIGATDSVLVPAGVAQVGAGLRLSPRIAAELRGFVGVCSPRVGVNFANRSVARYGQPFVGAALGVAVGVF
jgi:hypothetical protein